MFIDNFGILSAKKKAAKAEVKKTAGKDWRKAWKEQKASTILKLKTETKSARQNNRKEALKGLGSWVQNTAGGVIDKLKANQQAQMQEDLSEMDTMGREADVEADEPEKSNTMLYVGIFGGLAVVAVIVILILKNRKKQ